MATPISNVKSAVFGIESRVDVKPGMPDRTGLVAQLSVSPGGRLNRLTARKMIPKVPPSPIPCKRVVRQFTARSFHCSLAVVLINLEAGLESKKGSNGP